MNTNGMADIAMSLHKALNNDLCPISANELDLFKGGAI